MELESLKTRVDQLAPPAALLINTLRCSNKSKVAVLSDFNLVLTLDVDLGEDHTEVEIARILELPRQDSLTCVSWSPDGKLLAAVGRKVHLYLVSKDYEEVALLDLYYIAKDIDICHYYGNPNGTYFIIIAGPNGVEMHTCILENDKCSVVDVLSLHIELPIAHIRCSSNGKYLAVAAMDGHFGIWKMNEKMEEHKDFWYIHLKTLRITSIEFSEDNEKVAVSCWDGSFYVFQMVPKEDKFEWTSVEYNLNSSIEKVDGTVPGTLVSWSHHDKYFCLCNPTKAGTHIYVYCVETGTVQQSTVCGSSDYVKGFTVVQINGHDCLAYFTKDRKFGFLSIKPKQEGQLFNSATPQKECSIVPAAGSLEELLTNDYGTVRYTHCSSDPRLHVQLFDSFLNIVREFEAEHEPSSELNRNNVNKSESGNQLCNDCHDSSVELRDNDVREMHLEVSNKVSRICQQISQTNQHEDRTEFPLEYSIILSHDAVGFLSSLTARLYLFEKQEWKPIIFRKEVLRSFLCSGHWLVYLNSENNLCAFNLTNGCLRKCESAISLANKMDDIIIAASATQCYFVIFDINSTGAGLSLEVEFTETMHVTKRGVCLPFLSKSANHREVRSSLIGQLVIVQATSFPSSTSGEGNSMYHVIVPGLGIYRSFQAEEGLTLPQFCSLHSQDLRQLQRLATFQ
ncbi:uncharacterized protein [Ptychodera flava]|uniref:uncharacterized protein n=1 Tax=Ptychodera flava TaxID=63121 RepID=UPI003969FDD8